MVELNQEDRRVLGVLAETLKIIAEDLEHACAEGDAPYIMSAVKELDDFVEKFHMLDFAAKVFFAECPDVRPHTEEGSQAVRQLSAESGERFNERHARTWTHMAEVLQEVAGF